MKQLPINSFSLVKKDGEDFDREAVTSCLNITPTESAPPVLSKGLLNSEENMETISADLPGITVFPADGPPYRYLKNAFWEIALPKRECWEIAEAIQDLEQNLRGKSTLVRKLCETFHLFAIVEIHIFAASNAMPVTELSQQDVAFWAGMGAQISFDFYLD